MVAPPPKNVSKIPPPRRRRRRRLRGKYRTDLETAAAPGRALGKSGMAKAIVGGALVGIHQDVVGFAELFEFLLGVRIVRILVRMKFDRELAIRALDLFLGRLARDA